MVSYSVVKFVVIPKSLKILIFWPDEDPVRIETLSIKRWIWEHKQCSGLPVLFSVVTDYQKAVEQHLRREEPVWTAPNHYLLTVLLLVDDNKWVGSFTSSVQRLSSSSVGRVRWQTELWTHKPTRLLYIQAHTLQGPRMDGLAKVWHRSEARQDAHVL